MVFVAIPRSALFWVANSLDVFGDGTAQVRDPTSGPVGPANDGDDSNETRTTETFRVDLARRARAIDGDTIEVGPARIRLFGVDAPESAQRCVSGGAPGRAVSRRRGRLPGASRDVPWFARSAIGIGTGASLRCAGTARMTSMPGWSARVGRWPTGGTRRHTLARRRRRKRRRAERGEGNSFLHGIGAGAIAWISPLGTFLASVHVIEVPATSRGTSATAPESASTTFPVVETMNARASVGREARSVSAPKPKREQPAGGERAVDRAHCG